MPNQSLQKITCILLFLIALVCCLSWASHEETGAGIPHLLNMVENSSLPKASGFILPVYMLLLILATQMAEDLTCIAAGLLIARNLIPFWPATLACLLGIFIGDVLLYCAGRYLGQPALQKIPFRWFISESDVNRMSRWFTEKGPWIIFITRFIPGTRLPTYFGAGVLHLSFSRFASLFLIAAAIWAPIIVFIAARAGAGIIEYLEKYEKWSFLGILIFLLGFLALLHIILPSFTWRGRRILLSRFRKVTYFGIWPSCVFYFPVCLYILYLGLRYRSLSLLTAANPAIPSGGFVNESKNAILKALCKANKDVVAPYTFIPQTLSLEEKRTRFLSFLKENHFSYPIVLKPDIGQRGRKVAIIHSEQEALTYFQETAEDIIVQEYIPGHEFGLFYYRYPNEPRGYLFAIIDKQFPSVTGDGKKTLENLILADDWAISFAKVFLERHKKHLLTIPAKGAVVPLVELGNHCRGALLLDRNDLNNPLLEEKIDRISQNYQGFYFGRYDIRVPSIQALQEGTGLKIIELNGITSEPSIIYDPKHTLWFAYRTLMKHLRIVYEIGAQNRARGFAPTSVWGMIRMVWDYAVKKDLE